MTSTAVFFFGAGAESDRAIFNLPSGAEYTLRTMQHRQEKLYRELRTFYKPRLSANYVDEYRDKFLFEKDSHTFREIIYRAAIRCYGEGYRDCGISVFDEYTKCAVEVKALIEAGADPENSEKLKVAKAALKDRAKLVYDTLIKNEESTTTDLEERDCKCKNLKDYLSFYGAVEKDFSAIVNPDEVGRTQFWRLINYFWSAFFTIVEPLCQQLDWYKGLNNDKQKIYHYILSNLNDVLSSIYTEYSYERIDGMPGNYYRYISDNYPNSIAVTTNYTPFVEHYFPERNVYLAGRLSEFEYPRELSVKNIINNPVESHAFVFPFLMTQAPVKPIVVSNQIREYSAMLDAFDEADKLVIIGYSLDSADNHIIAMLREFALKNEKEIIYCDYDSENKKAMSDIELHPIC